MGAEKLKDTGYGGLPVRTRGTTFDMIGVTGSAPGHFAQLASAYRRAHGVGKDDLKRAMAHVSVKSHANGAKNPKAHLRSEVTMEQLLTAPMTAEPHRHFACRGLRAGATSPVGTAPDTPPPLGADDNTTVQAPPPHAS